MPNLGVSGLEFENQRPRVCIIAKFGAKIKIHKFGLKLPHFGIFGLNLKIILSYLNQVPRICVIAERRKRIKRPKSEFSK